MSWQADATQRYGAIVAGLLIGTAARYGLVLNEGGRFTWKGVLGDMLLLGLVGLVAVIVSDHLGLHGDARAFGAALAAVSSDRLIKLLRTRFEAVAEQRIGAMGRAATAADFARVPAGTGAPPAMTAEFVGDAQPVAPSLRRAYRAVTGKRPPADMIDALRQLPPDDTV